MTKKVLPNFCAPFFPHVVKNVKPGDEELTLSRKGSILAPSKAKALTEEIPPAPFVFSLDIAREE